MNLPSQKNSSNVKQAREAISGPSSLSQSKVLMNLFKALIGPLSHPLTEIDP